MTEEDQRHAPVAVGGRVYKVRPCMRLVCDIEDELEGVAHLARRFEKGQWKVSELVSLAHMMIQSCGSTMDYHALGDRMMAEGLDRFVRSALQFFNLVLDGRKT